MRSTNFELVGDFQREVLGNRRPVQPRMPLDRAMAVQCLDEEVKEFADALSTEKVEDAVDALVDLVYFAMGTCYQMGVDFDEAFLIVHTANLLKRKGVTKRGETANGDAVKPEGWCDPKAAIRSLIYGPAKP